MKISQQGQLLLIMYKKELRENLFSPLFYVLCAPFCFILAWLFFNYLMAAGELSNSIIKTQVLIPLFGNMNFMFLFIAPILSMGTFSQERKNNTLQLLYRSRLSHSSILLAKWAAQVTCGLFMLAPTLIIIAPVMISSPIDFGILFSGYLGLFLSLGCYFAVGIFTSTLNANPMLSAIFSFVILLSIMLLVFSAQLFHNVFLGQFFQYFSIPFHFEALARGVLTNYSMAFFVSFIFFFLYLARQVLLLKRI